MKKENQNNLVENEIHPMILEYTTTEDNEIVILPLMGDSLNAQVDWGDGAPVETVTSDHPTHEYVNSGVYNVKISGTVPRIGNNAFFKTIKYLTGIKSWGKLDGLTSMHQAFWYCDNLRGELPGDDYGCFENVIDFTSCFEHCCELTSIPENLFVNCSNVIYFGSCFECCHELTSIPEDLFINCYNVKDFSFCFDCCKGLTSIPKDLFTNCPNVVNFCFCFYGCRITSIPKDLFANCPNVTNFSSCFSNCIELTSIPENLFNNCPNITDFIYCFYASTGLTGNTPVDIMEDGTRVELWERAGKPGYPNSIDGRYCFNNCPNLSNFSGIPSEWK